MNLGTHTSFIVASYALAAIAVGALTAWIALDYRKQTRTLREMEERGVTRRSQRDKA